MAFDISTVGGGIGGAVNTAKMLIMVISIASIMSIVGFVAVWVMQHKVRLHIYELTASKTLQVRTYKARLSKRAGLTEIKPLNPLLKWITIYIKPPNRPNTWYSDGRNQNLMLYKAGNDTYEYVKFNIKEGDPQFNTIIDEDMKTWVVNQFKATELKYTKPSLLEKYGPIISMLGVGIFYIFGLIWFSG